MNTWLQKTEFSGPNLPAWLPLSEVERYTLAEIAKRLGRKALEKVACVAKPDTILAWYQRLIARKFDGSPCRAYPGRPRILAEVEELVVSLWPRELWLGLRPHRRRAG